MIFTTHAITGATIGVLTGNPILAFFLSWLSHYVLDSLPHFDQGSFYVKKDKGPAWVGIKYSEKDDKFRQGKRDWTILFLDFILAAVLGLYLLFNFPTNLWILLIFGGLGGILPDIFDGSPFWKDKFKKTKIGKPFHNIHNFFHWPLSMKYLYFGIGIQIVVVAIDLFLIRRLF